MAAQIKTCFERYEKKYRLTAEQQRAILQGMAPYMKKDTYGAYTICNIYYDTPDWRLIRTSLEKPVYKEKLRVRSYGVPGEDGRVFVELKKKYDGVVYKRRVTMRADEAVPFLAGQLPDGSFGQIGQEIRWFQQRYRTQPGVFIAYDRLAFAGIDEPELRITFDTNLRWRDTELDLRLGDHGAPITDPDMILMEIKFPGVCPLWLSRLLSREKVFPTSFSKYGACYRNHILPNIQKEGRTCASLDHWNGLELVRVSYLYRRVAGAGHRPCLRVPVPRPLHPEFCRDAGHPAHGGAGGHHAGKRQHRRRRRGGRRLQPGAFPLRTRYGAGDRRAVSGYGHRPCHRNGIRRAGGPDLCDRLRRADGADALGLGQKDAGERLLKITIPEDLDYEGLFDDLFTQYTTSHTLVRVKTSNMGTLYELEYRITLRSKSIPKEFLDALRCRNGNLNIVCGRELVKDAL